MTGKKNKGQTQRLKERGKVLINFEIEPEFAKALRDRARAEERTVGGMIRLALRAYLSNPPDTE